MSKKRQNRETVRYTNIGGLIFFELIIVGMWIFALYFIHPTLKHSMLFDVNGNIDIAGFCIVGGLTVLIQLLLFGEWMNRKRSLKKLEEWKSQGLEVKQYDFQRRHYYKM